MDSEEVSHGTGPFLYGSVLAAIDPRGIIPVGSAYHRDLALSLLAHSVGMAMQPVSKCYYGGGL